MGQALLLLQGNLKHRIHQKILLVLLEIYIPLVLLSTVLLIKILVQNEIILEDKYEIKDKIEGPICRNCSYFGCEQLIKECSAFPISIQELPEFYNPFKQCMILNNPIIAVMGNFISNKENQLMIQLLLSMI